MLLGATSAGVLAQPGAPGSERFVLTGMVVWSGNEGVAWLQEPDLTRNEMVALRIGERVGPWKLTRFLDNGVELEGPAGKVLIPLHNAGGGGGSAVAAGAPAGPAPVAPSAARVLPRGEAPRVASPPAAVSAEPGYVWEANRPAPSAGAFGEALSKARSDRRIAADRECAGPTPRGGSRRQPGCAWLELPVRRHVLRWCE